MTQRHIELIFDIARSSIGAFKSLSGRPDA